MHFPAESTFPQPNTPAIVGSDSLSGTLNSSHSTVQQRSLHRQLEDLSHGTLKPFEQGDGTGVDNLTQQNTESVVRGKSRWQLAEKPDPSRFHRKLHSNDGDLLTGTRKQEHLVGETGHGLAADKSLTRSLQSAPPFPGRLMKYSSGQPMMQGEDVRKWQAQMRSRGWSIDVDGVYGPQSATVCRQFQQEKHLQVDGIVGSQTWSAAWTAPIESGGSPSAPSGAATGSAIAQLARNIAEGKYNGGQHPQYVFGAENDPFNPSSVKRTDCSELVQVVVSSTLKKTFVDGSWNQYAACQKISVAQAMQTPGALLFIADGGRVHHVEVSLGNGDTAAARSTRSGVGVFKGNIGFTSGGLIPGIKY